MSVKTYRIGEAAELLNLKSYVLRFWETEFPQLEPLRTDKGQRLYTEEHLRLLMRIKYLLHERGLTIEGAKRMLAEQQAGLNGVDLLAESKAASDTVPSLLPGSQDAPSTPLERTGKTDAQEDTEKPDALSLVQLRLKAHTDRTLNFLDSLRPDFGTPSNAPHNAPETITGAATGAVNGATETPGSANRQPPESHSANQINPDQPDPASAGSGAAHSGAIVSPSGISGHAGIGGASLKTDGQPSLTRQAGAGFVQELLDELEELRRMLKA